MSLAWACNTAWMLAGLGELRAFLRATRRVADEQGRLLQEILDRNATCWFGRRHHFARLRGPAEYQREVPVMEVGAFSAASERIAAGEPEVLTAEPVLLLEPTSGTTSGEKLIPYTASLRRQFQRAIAAWVSDLFWHRPAARRGRAYWSVSPALPRRRSPGGLPIGFDEDASYLGGLTQWLVRQVLVAPPTQARSAELSDFRLATLAALLEATDLSLVSVWNPTFFIALLDLLDSARDAVLARLTTGRRREVEAGLGSPAKLWPRLALLSCWTDAAAAEPARRLRELMPHVEVQPKGLLATEGVVSIPLVGRAGAALTIRSHFFELVEAGGEARLAHQLERGGRYRVLLTTGGGLYRYPLGDEIEVVDFLHQCPLLRFLGKADRVSDRVGEKLAEPFVRAALERVLARHGLAPSFALLAPTIGPPDSYTLYLQGCSSLLQRLGMDLQEALEENPYYKLACGLGQLAPVRASVVPAEVGPAWRLYEARMLARGQKLGDIKPAVLDGWTGWAEVFGEAAPCGQASGADKAPGRGCL
jgi:hypothetical protein